MVPSCVACIAANMSCRRLLWGTTARLFVLNGWVSPLLCVAIPRIVIIILIFQDRGMSPWLLLHGIAMAGAYSEGGSRTIHKVVHVPAGESADRNKRLYL